MKPELSIQTQGRWFDILNKLGIDKSFLKNKKGPCPVCGGRDRFRFDDKNGRGTHFCNQCGSGDGVSLAMKYMGISFIEAANEIRSILGECRIMNSKQSDSAQDLKKAHDRLKFIHKGLKPISHTGVVAKYLANRGITVLPEKDVYEHNNIAYYGTPPDDQPVTGVFNAMVSRVSDIEGKMVKYHITYLTPDGQKISFATAKIQTAPCQGSKGSSIKMFQHTDILGIAEGIESSLAAYATDGFPMWCAYDAQGMISVEIPKAVENVLIYVDEDRSFTGQMAAYTLAHRLKVREGKNVRVVRLRYNDKNVLEQEIDQGLDVDFNDYLLSQYVRDRKTA
jgi:putative DNA primase/helicase